MVSLLGGAARAVARSMIPGYLAAGFTRNMGLSALRAGDVGIRRQDFLKLWSEISGQKQVEQVARFIPRKFKPTQNTITESVKRFQTEYVYVFKTTISPEGGAVFPIEHVSIGTDTLESINHMAGLLAPALEENRDTIQLPSYNPDDLVFVGVLHRTKMDLGFED